MLKKSFYNAICAFSYISGVALLIWSLQNPNVPDDNNIFIPIAMLSLLVISVAMMGYFFVWGPLELVIEGKKQEAAKYFLTTIGIFACFVVFAFMTFLLF